MAIVWNPSAIQMKDAECTCAPCKHFWKRAYREGAERIVRSSEERCTGTAVMGGRDDLIHLGDRVIVKGEHKGVVKFVGIADDHKIAPEIHVGVSTYDNVYSTHNGMYKGKRYFFCPRGHGAMVRYSEISPLTAIPRTRPVEGNSMFPSFEAVRKRRKEREEKIRKAEEKMRKEHEVQRRAQMEKYSKSAPPPRISPRPTRASRLRFGEREDGPGPLQDEHDIAYRDYINRERKKKEEVDDPELLEEIKFQKMKKAFGGDEKAARMAETLRKLHLAYEEGKIVAMAERE